MDSLNVQTEVAPGVYLRELEGSDSLAHAQRRFTVELRRATGVGLTVQLKPAGEFKRTQFKARRIINKRNL